MAARLTVARAKVSTPGAQHEGVAILVRNGTARVTTPQGEVRASGSGVVAVRAGAAGMWEVAFADGSQWIVERVEQPCGCR